MVAKQKLPGFVNWIIFINTLNLLSYQLVDSSNAIQYCWSGAEDEPSGWMNLTCATNHSALPNTVSRRTLPSGTSPNETSHDVSTGLTGKKYKKYYCMAFQYNETTINNTTGDKITRVEADYSCDSQNLCAGRNVYEGYKIFSDKRNIEGYLYCCDSGDNCNTHMLIYKRIHQHTCYTGDSETHSLSIDHCPHKKSHCVKTVITKTTPESPEIETLREIYGCDINNRNCSNLTEAENHSCRETKSKMGDGTTIDTRVCCCKSDNCYIPQWAEGYTTRGARNKPSMQNNWQRTMLIIIGVALGILVVGVTLFFVRKSVLNSKQKDSPTNQYNKTAYRSMTMENGVDTDDTVQILST